MVPSAGKGNPVNPWSLAVRMDDFLGDEEEPVKFLFAPVIVKKLSRKYSPPEGLEKVYGHFSLPFTWPWPGIKCC